ncbi:conserved exported protein of unknown function [Sterolibacterium denitrificans]|uniref:DUF3108 domain-containing protein n=1 Tax=Sterolibacterium denitrificans TaxID=157592 RepID=A0A7Z7MUX3_9PROT|nr:DUF3108 domain-containing protein [Sterolibacterium denitrificans]SMB24773.1 conserved exported protein of unknown function [Sterolibacterium denitrificans]
MSRHLHGLALLGALLFALPACAAEEPVGAVAIAAAGGPPAMPQKQLQPQPASANAPGRLPMPAQGRLRFELTRGDGRFVAAEALHEWRHDGKQYELQSVTETVGLVAFFRSTRIVWRSRGNVTAQGLQPLAFQAEKRSKPEGGARFDWTRMRLSLDGGPQRELALLPRSQDLLSMFYQLGVQLPELRRLASKPARPDRDGLDAAREFVMPVTNGRKLERYHFELLGEEPLNLSRLGRRQTLHLRTHAGEQLIDIWLDLQAHGLPVKIRYADDKGDAYDQTAVHIDISAADEAAAGAR